MMEPEQTYSMENLTPEQMKVLKSLRADRLGFLLMGLILGGGMIAVAAWVFWTYGFRKLWMLIAALGYLFVNGGISIWKDKTQQIGRLSDPMLQEERAD
jgi:hypothetical protein